MVRESVLSGCLYGCLDGDLNFQWLVDENFNPNESSIETTGCGNQQRLVLGKEACKTRALPANKSFPGFMWGLTKIGGPQYGPKE